MSLIPPVRAATGRQPAVIAARTTSLSSRALRWLFVMLAAVGTLAFAAWLVLQWAILPHIQQWRGAVEARASAALGAPVRIGRIAVRTGAWMPALDLEDVVLADTAGREALRLPRVAAALSARSLLGFELRFDQLVIDGAVLDVRRDAAGRVFVAGRPVDGGPAAGAGSDPAGWLLDQRELVVRAGTVRWSDETRDAPPLVLTDVQIVIRNRGRQHDARIDATPPAAWGERLHAVGRFTSPRLARGADRWRRWSGQLHAQIPHADLRELRRYATLPLELGAGGDGALRAWVDVDAGRPVGATVDLALRTLSLRMGPDVDRLDLVDVRGRVTAERRGEATTLALHDAGFRTTDGMRWPEGGRLKLGWRQAPDAAAGADITGGEVAADRLDLAVVARLAAHLPLAAALRRQLAELQPVGRVTDLAASWDGPLDAPRGYRARGAIAGLELAARADAAADGIGRPGVRRADVRFDADQRGGSAELAIAAGALELPGVFADPLLPFDRLTAKAAWTIEPAPTAAAPPKITVRIDDARFANADARGELRATWTTGPGSGVGREGRYPGRLVLDSTLVESVATRTARYLPLGLPASARSYVERAVRGGTLRDVRFHVDGGLWDFPYASPARAAGGGQFRIDARLDDVSFAYLPAAVGAPAQTSPWPAVTRVDAELSLDRARLEVRNASGRLAGADWSRARAVIGDLDAPVLQLDAEARGPATEMLHFVNTTPVGSWMQNALARSTATGHVDLKLGLKVPLQDADASSVRGSVTFDGNDLAITPGTPALGRTTGRVDFTQDGFAIVGGAARVLGGEARFDGGARADGSLRFSGQGVASADGLRRATELGPLARLAANFSGQAAYRLQLGLVRGQTELDVTSDLVGLASQLPAPLTKPADTALALRYQTVLAADTAGDGAPSRDTLRLELGNLLHAAYQRDLSVDPPRVLRGGIGVMEAAPQPSRGVAAHVTLAALDADAWQAVLARLVTDDGVDARAADTVATGAGAGTASTSSPATAATATAAGGYAPDAVALRVQTLTTGGRRIERLVAGASQRAGVWRANVDADQFGGYVELRPARGRNGHADGGEADAIYARLARLSLPRAEAGGVQALVDEAPARLPALDIVVDAFELHGKRLGRLELEATNQPTGNAAAASREWRMSKLNLTTPEAQLTAHGSWAAPAGNDAGRSATGAGATTAPAGTVRRRTALDFQLAIADSGALLDRLGTPGAIQGGKGRLSGQVAWLGAPFALDYPSLGGQLRIAIDAGQFLKAEPGAARLLGVLSLQSLPRRFALDFRDVFAEGFAFDNVTGDVSIERGQARTNNLRMRGVQAVVLMDGSADIARETQATRVWVVPEINAGTASLAYAVINPAIGIGTFLAQVMLKKQLVQAGTREFRVHGSWSDPQVDPVARKLTDDVPSTETRAAPDVPAAAAESAPMR